MKVVCDASLKPQLVNSLRLLGIVEDTIFDIFGDALKKTPQTADIDRTRCNLEAATYRLTKCFRNSHNEYALRWYAAQNDKVMDRLEALDPQNETSTEVPEKKQEPANGDGFKKATRKGTKSRVSSSLHSRDHNKQANQGQGRDCAPSLEESDVMNVDIAQVKGKECSSDVI